MKFPVLVAGALLALSWARAQNSDLDLFDLGRAQDISAKAMGMGGAYTAAANDFAALFYNPAGLSSVKRHELSFGLEGEELQVKGRDPGFATASSSAENLGIQSLGLVLPVPTVQGGLSFAFGFYTPRTFNDILTYNDAASASRGAYEYRAQGDLTHYRLGMGLDLSPNVVFGLALGFIDGSQKIQVNDSVESRWERGYTGYEIEPSLLFRLTPALRFGASVVAKESQWIGDAYQQRGGASLEEDYYAKLPLQFKFGLAYHGPAFQLAADYWITNWGNYQYGLDNTDFLEYPEPRYPNEQRVAVGGEVFVPPMGGVVRAGYTYNTLLENDFQAAYDIHRVSAGLGFLLNGSVSIDLAYAYAFWEESQGALYVENHQHRGLLTLAYRY